MSEAMNPDLGRQVAAELSLPERSVSAVLRLLGEGNTVPFIARYRKEATEGLDEVQIRDIEERHAYRSELEERRRTILASIEEQGKLTGELRARIAAADTKAALEDLYLPYKPKRRTRATIAREKGLEPLADRIAAQPPAGSPEAEAAGFVSEEKGVADAAAALAGARDILAERVAEHAEIRAFVRRVHVEAGQLVSEVVAEKAAEGTKFKDFYAHSEPVARVPSHRFLAMRRGEKEGVLRVRIDVPAERVLPEVLRQVGHAPSSPFGAELEAAATDGYQRLLAPAVETEVRTDLKMKADTEAVEVFARNLREVLLASPLGEKPVVAIDPGLRTGCKTVAIDETGRFTANVTLQLVGSAEALSRAERELVELVKTHRPAAVAIGNGTAGRETEAFVRKALADAGLGEIPVVSVNEAGASVYSASKVAREEFPDLDVTVRGAISIGRRLQDPLAELVKIEPKSIGVGQYQHDVHQPLLVKKLDEVVESCVNGVGVELNTASAPLLSHVAGIGPKVATSVVAHRQQHGLFTSRRQLLDVSGVGPKTFEQAAGFLRVRGSGHPLDASGVHPERYELVERIAGDMGVALADLVGNAALADRIEVSRYVGPDVGEPTLRDIVDELRKPGRDPRARFEPPKFRDDVRTLQDLKVGMELEGVVTNVTAFGAFVDVGVHHDGLVHISQLSDRFVQDPHSVVKTGDRIKVRVLSVDLERERIGLTARSGDPAAPKPRRDDRPKGQGEPRRGDRERGEKKTGRGGRPPERAPRQEKPAKEFGYNPFKDLKGKKG